jgi:uncharacterized protein YaaN involved in tellurite resistance
MVNEKALVKPNSITEEDAQKIQEQAANSVNSLVVAKGTDVFKIEDEIANIGVKDQKNISSSIALLQEKMGNVFYSDNKANVTDGITKDISNLQTTLVRINPKDIQKESRYRIIRYIPFFGNWMVSVLKESSNRRMTLKEFVDHLEDSLKHGELMLRQDNAQLTVMYGEISEKQKLIDADAYFAEVLIEKLTEKLSEVDDERKRASINKVMFKLATRAQDLRAMENIYEQFYTSIGMTRDNNDMLIATVQRMLTMGMNVVYVAFAIHAALVRQQNIIDATRGTREFIGNMIVKNASMINSHVKEIGDLYKQPVVAMEKMEQAIEQLEQAIEATNKLKAEGIVVAKENIIRIKSLTEEMKNKSGDLPESDVESLESSNVLQLN